MKLSPSLPRSIRDRPAQATHRYWIYLVLAVLGMGYICLTWNGYGNHDDIYRMIGTWRTLLSEQRYQPSRFQGNLIPEVVIGFTSQLGDFYLSNLVSAVLAIASLWLFYQLLTPAIAPLPAALGALVIGTNPYWIIAATTSTDYIYPAFFFILGIWLLAKQQFRLAGLVFALAVSARLTYGPMAAIALAFFFPVVRQENHRTKRFFQGILIFLGAAAILYLPVFFASGMSLAFLGFADDTAGGTGGKIARFLYKSVYFWGLPAFLVLVVFFVQERRFYWQQFCKFPFRHPTPPRLLFHGVFWLLVYTLLLFAKLPHQYQYLLPILFCVVVLITQFPDYQKQVICLSLIAVLHLVHGVVNFDVLETYQIGSNNTTIHSDGAVFKPGIRPGILVRDYQWRSRYQRQLTADFNQRWQHFGRPLSNPR
jgi:hypothetical protein